MQATCRYSGVTFRIEHFPYIFTNSTQHHPTFDIPTADLLRLSQDWLDDRYNPVSRRLLFLALLRSTELVHFRTYARPTDATIASNFEELIEWSGYIHGLHSEEQFAVIPRYVISADTADLSTIDGWFSTWSDAIAEYKDRYRTYDAAQIQLRREDTLARLIKDPSRTTESYARLLAEWASVAASFPEGLVPGLAGDSIPLSAYWRDLMIKCGSKSTGIYKLPLKDLEELEEFLEYSLPHGSIIAHETMLLVRTAIARHNSVLGIVAIDSPTFAILSADDSVEKATILNLIALAPSVEPRREDYPDKVSFLRAKGRWILKGQYEAGQAKATKLGL